MRYTTLVLSTLLIASQVQAESGLSEAALPDTCVDLAGVDFGLCDMPLGVALIDGACVSLSGCDWVVDDIDYSPYFFSSIGECNGACGIEQDCVDPSLINPDAICPMIWAPVCGCDGVTYSNDCVAVNLGGVTSWTVGECPPVTCVNPAQIDLTQPCPDIWAPVCGCDSITYSGPCDAWFYGGVVSYSQGTCEETDGCPLIPEYVDFGDCEMVLGYIHTNEGCVTLSGCSTVGSNGYDYNDLIYASLDECQNACMPVMECFNPMQVDTTMFCINEWDPVCGCDSVTYSNECFAFYYGGVTSWVAGECSGGTGIVTPSPSYFLAYPNPGNNALHIRFSQSFSGSLSISDATGRVIYFTAINATPQVSLDLSSFPEGMYLVKAKHSDGMQTVVKWVKGEAQN
ncbi:MAG: T9SS type A sorting domain-containing protein [Flavobacteriales bacterium]|nr:T9SS type A sorting domain-containing protein [Flavobacteriales bacterium]